MKLTFYTDYALRVLIYLGVRDQGLATITEIADRYDISRNHIVKVVHELGRLGYIETVRGKNGGIRLDRDPATINVGELVRRTENGFELVECFRPDNGCCLTPACVLRDALDDALQAFIATLDGYTLADLLAPRQRLQRLLAITS